MIDFEEARTKMVDCQVRTVDVTDLNIISAMLDVPREEFVTEDARDLAYIDEDVPLGFDGLQTPRYLIEPAPFAKLLQLAEIKPEDVVMDIGCASGYTSAVLSKLCTSVVAVEEDPVLAELASNKLTELAYHNAVVVPGAHEKGCKREGPYDVILISGAVEYIPQAILDQLKEDGRLVVVEGLGNAAEAKLFVRDNDILSSRFAFNCALKPLPGFQKQPVFEL